MKAETFSSTIWKVIKSTRRLFNFALRELEIIEANPLADFGLKKIPSRKTIWNSFEVAAVIAASHDNTKDNKKAYPSVGLAVLISVTTTLPLGDILALKWNQFDGEAFTVQQIKERGKLTLYIPLTDEVIHELEIMLQAGVNSTHIICFEGTGRPYP